MLKLGRYLEIFRDLQTFELRYLFSLIGFLFLFVLEFAFVTSIYDGVLPEQKRINGDADGPDVRTLPIVVLFVHLLRRLKTVSAQVETTLTTIGIIFDGQTKVY